MKNMKRSVRRHHYERLKKNWYRKLKDTWYWDNEWKNDEEFLKFIACFLTTTPATCSSCLGHINPRKNGEITLQEYRNLLSFMEQVDSILD